MRKHTVYFPVKNIKKARGAEGFNLLELMLTILVLAILVGICVPVFIGRAKSADKTTAIANLRIGENCYDSIWYSRLATQGKDAYRDYDPPEALKNRPEYQANGWVLVDGYYMSLEEPKIGWADLEVSEGSEPVASAEIQGLGIAAAPEGFRIKAIWLAGARIDKGVEDTTNWALLAHKIGVVTDYYWEDGWKPNPDNKYVTLIVLEKSGTAHYVVLNIGRVIARGNFQWENGRGNPGNGTEEGSSPVEEPSQPPEGDNGDDGSEGDNPVITPPLPDNPVDPGNPGTPGEPIPPEEPGEPGEPEQPEQPPAAFTVTIVRVEPETLNLSSQGLFTVYISFPEGRHVSDTDMTSLRCSGAVGIECNVASSMLVVKFYRQDLVDVPTGNNVVITVTGRLNDGTPFVGYDTIRVIRNK